VSGEIACGGSFRHARGASMAVAAGVPPPQFAPGLAGIASPEEPRFRPPE